MFSEIALAILLGAAFGIFTGITPGIHVNLIAAITLSAAGALTGVNGIAISAFIASLALTHTFIDSIPSIYLGAPDESMALAALPGHRMLLRGQGHDAVRLTLVGSSMSLILAFLLSPLLYRAFILIHPLIRGYIGWMLLFLMAFLLIRAKSLLPALFFLASGLLGVIVLNIPNARNVLLPMLSGLFGASILIVSLNNEDNRIPLQENKREFKTESLLKATIGATGIASVAGFLPGLGSSQSAIIAQSVLGDMKDEGFLLLTGGINTVNMAVSLITLYALDKARNGAVLAISKIIAIAFKDLLLLISAMLISAGISILAAIKLSLWFQRLIKKVDHKRLTIAVLLFMTMIVIIFSGALGILILVTSTSLGILCMAAGTGKNNLMGSLMIPVILYFII